jgi:hypothetical protein
LCNHCCSGKAVSIKQPVCVLVTLGIQHAMRMRHIVICGLPRSTIFFHIITLNATIFQIKGLNKKCVFRVPLQFLSEIFFDSKKNLARYDYKCTLVFIESILYSCLIFSTNTQISNFMKIRLVGTKLFHADGRTDRHNELNRSFAQVWRCA